MSGYGDLAGTSLEALMARARSVRDDAHGRRTTFSPKVFIPLTMLCRDRCGYCTFAQPPARLESPYLTPEQVLAIAKAGAAVGVHEALFTLGEGPEDRYPVAREWLSEHGYASTVAYLAAMAQLVLDETGLLPHANAGALSKDDLATLRAVAPSQGMMIESLRDDLDCHRGAPDKTAARRLATLESAGELQIPFTTGILVGIGEDLVDRIAALEAIAASHRRHGHVQEVIVQNFLPKAGTAMHQAAPCPPDVFLQAIALARLILPPEIHLQAPPNLSDDFGVLLDAGIDDWGGVSPVTADHVNPERPWPALDRLSEVTEERGFALAPRLTIYPEHALEPDRWLDPALRFRVMDRSDAEGLGRDDPGGVFPEQIAAAVEAGTGAEVVQIGRRNTAWYSGAPVDPVHLVPASGRAGWQGPVGEVLEGVLLGQEVGEDEITTLFSARGAEVAAIAQVADELRRAVVGDTVTYVRNRNINYTNVCTFKCKFCGFSKGPLSLNLRGTPYLLTLEDIQGRVLEAVAEGATEVCLQGGIHPDFDGDYYIDVARAVHDVAPDIHIHGFTALEVTEGAKRLDEPLASYLVRLQEAGLRTLPGTAAEILDDPVRAILCPDKIDTEEWLEAHRTAHSVGLRSNVTIMFGAVEQPRSWARHLVRTRSLQKETGGFTEFVPLPFVHMAAPIYLQRKARRGPTFREVLLMHSVGRIAYRGWIDNVQVSWVKVGRVGASQVLQAGANDIGGTLMDENISRAAGASHGTAMDEDSFRSWVEPIGRTLEQRTTLYGRVAGSDPMADEILRSLLDEAGATANRDVLRDILRTAVGLAGDDADRLDLKITASALKEMRAAFKMFAPFSDVPKVTIFGSARTQPDHALYAQARDVARALAERGWMVLTGAGPGIMAAGAEGAGRERSLGVSIRLPFEEASNDLLDQNDQVVAMKYFFTRKLMLMKESSAFVSLPGGFGTQDETFELCTLQQTGKASPAPIVLLDVPGGTYWTRWVDYVDDELVSAGLVSSDDHQLYLVTDDVEAAVAEVEQFWRSYHSIRWVGDRLVLRLRHAPTDAEVAELDATFGDLLVDGHIERSEPLPPEVGDRDHLDLARLVMRYDARRSARLRGLINAVNALPSANA